LEFNEKLFHIQFCFGNINYNKAIKFFPGFKVNEEKIKEELMKFSLS